MKRFFFLAGLVVLLVFSGCVNQDVSNQVSRLPEIRAVLEQNPNTYVVTLFMKKEVVDLAIKGIRKDCPGLEPASYWYVTLSTEQGTWEFYVDEAVLMVVCTVQPEIKPGNECENASDCKNSDAGIKSECKGRPMKCVYTAIVECIGRDNFCPEGCIYANDIDCPAIDSCQVDADCDDSNSLTADTCTGTPKYCTHSLKSCEGVRGHECAPYEECKGSLLPVLGQTVCCDIACTKTKSCTGIVCEEWEKCVNGLCVKKSCEERELRLCTSSETCTGSNYIDDYGIKCCTGDCRQPCESDVNCDTGEVCMEGENYCIAASCSDIGGKTCDEQKEWCRGEIEATLDNDTCCLKCELKTCKQLNGIVCDASHGFFCSDSTIETFDEEACCISECTQELCFDKPCAINKKCVEGVCELKTCEEMNGVDWSDPATCPGNFYRTEGILDCCVQKTCDELGGLECLATQVCSETVRKSTDTEQCCVGTCLAAP